MKSKSSQLILPLAALSLASCAEKKMLTVREAKILQLFCKNINETVERKAILSRFWDTEDDYFKSRSLRSEEHTSELQSRE